MTESETHTPMHGDVWGSAWGNFSVMHVCGHHDPPKVTGYWHTGGFVDPERHDSIPLPSFVERFHRIESER